MSISKIILSGLVFTIGACALMYYLTLYPGPLSSPAVPTPMPVTVYIQATPLVPAVKVHPTRIPKPERTPKPTATPRPPKPRKNNPASQQIFPFGKPKATPGQ